MLDLKNPPKVGDEVVLVTPENPRLHNAKGFIHHLEEWGAYVLTTAAASGVFRALWSEMRRSGETVSNVFVANQATQGNTSPNQANPIPGYKGSPDVPKQSYYTGEFCPRCGSSSMRRTGTCSVCECCGESGGCV